MNGPTLLQREEGAVAALVSVARPLIRARYRADSCIESTRIGIAALRAHGVAAHPLVVVTYVMNPQFYALMEANGGQLPRKDQADEWLAKGAKVIVIGLPKAHVRESQWNGHLVLLTEGGWLVDLSIDQAARAAHGIACSAFYTEAPAGWKDDEERALVGWLHREDRPEPGACLVYVARPGERSHRETPAWRGAGWKASVGPVVRAMREEEARHGG